MKTKKAAPKIFVAPNGARRNKSDHANLPVNVGEVVATAKACFEVGADGLHAHVRDDEGAHVLDAGLYQELLGEMDLHVPGMAVQITTEAVGRYSPLEQRQLVMQVKPKMVSVALAEMFADDDLAVVSRFYYDAQEQEIDVQHIVYTVEEFAKLAKMILLGTIPVKQKSVLFVLGRYCENQQSHPDMLKPFLQHLQSLRQSSDWRFMVCAFGLEETDCLLASAQAGGDCRVGFENNLLHADGEMAQSNEARVSALVAALGRENLLT